MRKLLVSFFLLLAAGMVLNAGAQQPRHLFRTHWASVDKTAIAPGSWRPYPEYRDRAAWDDLIDGKLKERLIKGGERWLGYRWQALMATDYLEFERGGSREVMETPNSQNRAALSDLILAELAEGKGRFIDQIINGVWFFAGEPSWVLSAHEYRKDSGRSLPDYRDVIMDLGSQLVAHTVACALYFFRAEMDAADPAIAAYADHALDEKIFKPYLDPSKWRGQSWLGYTRPGEEKPYFWENWDPRNNWNTWCNYAVSETACLVCRDRATLLRVLDQANDSVDNYLDFVKMDGACDEGPGYWRHSSGCLFEFVELMNALTDGKFGCYDDPQFRARATYVSRCNIGDGWTVNFSDGSARSPGSPCFMYRLGKVAGIPEMTDLGLYLQACQSDPSAFIPSGQVFGVLPSLKILKDMKADFSAALADAGGDIETLKLRLRGDVPAWNWYPQTEHLIVRGAEGMTFAVKGGHNEESHNHNDVGSIILFIDEMPVLADVGPTSYMRQTFNKKERFTIWSMRSEWHNLPLMNGCPQHEGGEFRSSSASADERRGEFTARIEGAYVPEADLISLERKCRLKGKTLTITDSYALRSRKAPDEEHFMVPGEVSIVREGLLRIDYRSFDGKRSGSALMSYPKSLKASVEVRPLDDRRHSTIWGPTIRRIVLRSSPDAPLKGSYTVKVTKAE